MTITPFGDRILVEPVQNNQEKGGIIIPETAKEKPSEGIVVSIGEGLKDRDGNVVKSMRISVGQKVLYGLYAGTEIKVDGKIMKIIHQDDVIGVGE